MEITYTCPSCGATKTLSGIPQSVSKPDKIFCGFRGCRDFALPPAKKRPIGWLSDEGWQAAFREAVRNGDVILHERRQITRQDGSTYWEIDLSYKEG